MRDKVKGTIYYVDTRRGDDQNNGTLVSSPWQSLNPVNNRVFKPGDMILFEASGIWNGNLELKGSGKKDAPIIIDCYTYEGDTLKVGEGTTKPIINGGGQSLYTVWLNNVSFWELNHLEITNQGNEPLTGRTGIVVSADDALDQSENNCVEHIYLKHLYVHHVNGDATTKDGHNGGIYYHIAATDKNKPVIFKDVLVENCYVKDVARTGISVGSSKCIGLSSNLSNHTQDELKKYMHQDVVIRNNYIERSGGDAIVPQYCYEPLIEYNVAQEASIGTVSDPNLMYNAAIWPWQCYKALFQYNEAFGTYLNGDGQSYDCDFSWGTTYQYNYSHDNEGGFMLVCQANTIDSIVRYNISQNDKRCLFMTSNAQTAYIYNNTFYIGEGLETTIFSNDYGPLTFYNNIFYKEGTPYKVDWHEGYAKYNSNLYYGFINTPQDDHSVIKNPLFVDPGKGGTGSLEGGPARDTLHGYTLQSHSPAIKVGQVVSKELLPKITDTITKDFFGNPLGKEKVDLGAINSTDSER
nr:right-handed parallel beta-helix repeat-containing protein [uncultured Niameybacter sp.]